MGRPRGPGYAANRHRRSTEYRRARVVMFALYGDTCHLCGHRGARTADHLTPIKIAPDQPVSPLTMRPAHGRGSPCRECPSDNPKGRHCNESRGAREATKPRREGEGQGALRTSRSWDDGKPREIAPRADDGTRPVSATPVEGASVYLKTSREW